MPADLNANKAHMLGQALIDLNGDADVFLAPGDRLQHNMIVDPPRHEPHLKSHAADALIVPSTK
jgi:hypothetical protein